MNLEYTKIGIIQHFEKYGFDKYISSRPSNITDASLKVLRNKKGTQMSNKVLDFGIKKIESYITDFVENIYLEQLLTQLTEYTRENKTKYDLHSVALS